MANEFIPLGVKLVGSSAELTAACDSAEKRISRLKISTQQASTETQTLGLASGKTTFAIQQLAFGAQDAASVFGTSGLSGAIRAASNNVIQFASLLSPLAGTFAALAGTGIALVVDYFAKLESSANKAKKAIETTVDAMRSLEERAPFSPATQFGAERKKRDERRGIFGEDSATHAERRRKDLEQEARDISDEFRPRQAAIRGLQSLIDAPVKFGENPNDPEVLARRQRRFDELTALVDEEAKDRKRLVELEGKEGLIAIAKRKESDLAALDAERKRNEEFDNASRDAGKAHLDAIAKSYQDQEDIQKQQKRAKDIGRELLRETNPNAAKRLDIIDREKERISEINSLAISDEERARLTRAAKASTRAHLADLNPGEGGKRFTGAASFGSLEAFKNVAEHSGVKSDKQLNLQEQSVHLQEEENRILKDMASRNQGAFTLITVSQ